MRRTFLSLGQPIYSKNGRETMVETNAAGRRIDYDVTGEPREVLTYTDIHGNPVPKYTTRPDETVDALDELGNPIKYAGIPSVTSTRPVDNYELSTRSTEERTADLLEELVAAVRELTEAVKTAVKTFPSNFLNTPIRGRLSEDLASSLEPWERVAGIHTDEGI
jgi:hypothetical protein